MPRIPSSTIARWTAQADAFLASLTPPITRDQVSTGADAWNVAHRTGMCREAYEDRDIVDAHIKTALQTVFPQAVFKDKYRY